MTTFGYAERPAGVTGPTQRTPVNERLEPAPRAAADGMRGLAVRGEGRRVRNRTHHNEAPARPAVPGGNAKPAAGRLGTPSRPTMPAQGRRGEAAANSEPSAAETAVLPAVAAGDTAVLPAVPATVAPATGFPSRPDPSDPATEVWALVERAQAGEAEAFGLIYDRYVDTVFRFVYFRVGNRQLAEDLTSDTFLRALKRIGSFTWQGRDLGAWLVTIARNLVADHFKSGRYRLEVTTGDVLDADREDRGPEGSPEAAVVEHITNVALLTAVKQLNPEQQECIVLRFLQGFSVAETARAMGKNEGAIKALQYRAVRALARLLPDGFQP
ncbi:ECF subfamily RNA polymerase sigma factor, BldN family [Micromonospora chaiyaphumensis]|uniref:RNA polymerase sigma-70 factor, ECF subfamily n=1 Tax=Micromonospora chaiyaphumensis TaxID=307119 RepID=A0A1C4WYE9_9ACTN|nr:ECF subfamily RNA polymerase sigma factor, BldN family [Micromonospora chaiyaphumensis]SCF01164.1 RNA polymerase sigma-70 factor, ECF subfamily [Micromonospora chaiyaphumensis]